MIKIKREKGPGYARLEKASKDLEGLTGRIGYFSSARYEDGTPVATVAAIQEYGAPSKGIPARPTMRPAIIKNQKQWANLFSAGAKAIMAGNETARSVMTKVASVAAGNVREEIAALYSPPLKPSTILARMRKAGISKSRRRRFSEGKSTEQDNKAIGNLTKPLVETRTMITSVTYEVVEE
jgi:hypothetical protein